MEKKTIIITGGNAGIGKEAAMELAKSGARVIMACRNQDTGKTCRDEIIETTGNTNVILKKLDLSSFQSVRDFAEDINKNEDRLDVLIHNAGVWLSKNVNNDDGVDLTMATNQFGPFLLTHLLIDLLKKSAPSRIVIVSSVSHFFGRLGFDQSKRYVPSYFPHLNYFNSKFANVCFANELALRLKDSNITVNSLHPGIIKTDIWNTFPAPISWSVALFSKVFFKTAKEGCETIVYLAVSEDVDGVTGKYFVDCKKSHMSKRTRSNEFNKKFWEICKDNVGLRNTDVSI
ncbi:hypothetical protein RN001_011747 [Aquatica leii]|uniref:Retinol dehydrogenase 14 n=1 Tax=Aquatica leii TaxID=1421715 RepID=A0AAN7SP77_9COLE|nr:hypothetical protein RN001_011747 [Aquatica leii]